MLGCECGLKVALIGVCAERAAWCCFSGCSAGSFEEICRDGRKMPLSGQSPRIEP